VPPLYTLHWQGLASGGASYTKARGNRDT